MNLPMIKPFLLYWYTTKTMAQNTNPRFGLATPSLGIPESIIFKAVNKLLRITRTHRIKNIVAFHISLIGFAVKSTISRQQSYVMAKSIDSALMAAFKHFTVGWGLLLKQFPVNDQSILLLGKKQCIAEFDLCTGLTAN